MNLKHLIPLFALCSLIACNHSHNIEINVNVPGLSDAVFTMRGDGGILFSQNIVDGKCNYTGTLPQNGFYECSLKKNYKPGQKQFEVYLENGTCNITIKAGSHNYPHVQSSSKLQQEVSNYHQLWDSLSRTVPPKMVGYTTMSEYVKKYPQSKLSAHFMADRNYEDEPVQYKALYDRMSEDAKSSEDGKYIIKRINDDLRTAAGNKASQIEGAFTDGRTLKQVVAGKKIMLIDFWRSANYVSRINQDSLRRVYKEYKDKGFEIISVSLDTKELWWKTAMKDDKLPWPQVSDLKGNDSPNEKNWNITTIPSYYLVDSNWNILFQNIQLNSIEVEVRQYLEKHP